MARKPLGESPDGRCTYVKRDGERCKKPSMPGVRVCNTPSHGASLPSVRNKSQMARLERQYEASGSPIAPIPADDPEARGDVALATNIRRCVAWIRFCEAQIEALAGHRVESEWSPEADTALADVLGDLRLISREESAGTERGEQTSLTVEKYGAGIDVWEERLRWYMSTLERLTKQWINAGFEAKRLDMQSRVLDRLERAVDGIVRDLGANPRAPQTRAIIATRILEAASMPDEASDEAS